MSTTDTAVCIRTVNYSDTSQIVTLFTKYNGKLSAIAKGSKRKRSSFDGPIELFSFGQIAFISREGSQLATLVEFQQTPVFLPLRRKLSALNCAMFAAELIAGFTTEHDPHPNLFDAFTHFIEDVQSAGNDDHALALLILFQLTLLSEFGTKPLLNKCANCSADYNQSWHRTYFSSSANGLICPDCEIAFTDKQNLLPESVTALTDLKKLEHAEQSTLNQIEKTLVYHFTELLHKPPRMAKHFI